MSLETERITPDEQFDAVLAAAEEVPVPDAPMGPARSALVEEIEREVLAFYISGEGPEAACQIRPEYLSPVASRIFLKIREAGAIGHELRPSVLRLEGNDRALFDQVLGTSQISHETFLKHLDVLREAYRQSQFRGVYESLKDEVEGGPVGTSRTPIDSAIFTSARRLEDAVAEHARHVDPTLASYDFLSEYRRRPERRPTRFRELNRLMLGGFYPGSMLLLSGEAGAGKTAFILNLAADYARAGHRVVFFSLEMELYEIASRLVAYLSQEELQLSSLVNGKVPEATLVSELEAAQGILGNVVVEQMLADTTVHQVLSRVFEHYVSRTSKDKELVVVIDPFQRLNAGDLEVDRDDVSRTRSIAKEVKAFTNRLGLITLCTSDTTKEGTLKGGQTAIRGSYEAVHIATTTGHLELSADQPEEQDRRTLVLKITKNRGGLPKGKLNLSFHGETQRFHEVTRDAE